MERIIRTMLQIASLINSELEILTSKTPPKLKSGISFWRNGATGQLQIGSRFSNFLLPDQIGSLEIEPALRLLASGELAEGFETKNLLSILEELSLLDQEETEINYEYGEEENRNIAALNNRSVAQDSFLTRIEIEADGITRTPKVKDGGIRKVLERREFAIQIHGSGRIAFALLGTLFATGFELCEITKDFEVRGRDVIGGCVTKKDIGRAARLKMAELLLESSLYPEPSKLLKRANLIISIGSPPAEVLQEWNRERIPQLYIDFDNSGEIRIGPYIEPGFGACFNCVNIAENESGRPSINALHGSHSNDDFEVTAALATFSAGIVSLEVARIADTGKSDLLNKSTLYSTLNYLEPQITAWERHPRCGCNWL